MAKRSDIQIKQDITEYINNHGIMSLSTQYSEGPWICTVYYGLDDDMNFYIVTDPNSIHGKAMEKDNRVAFSIFDSNQKITDSLKGIQGSGVIEIIKNPITIAKALLLWHKRNPGIENAITLEDIKKLTDTKVFKITPTYFKFFNKELYGDDEYGIWDMKKSK
ncbi:TPA: hypothetical protein DCP76_00160 [Patescibacteria group bacterium]|nr:hypothetical protein [Patescibacteria group bacterium]